jgi:hypothetical protein
MKVFSYLNIFLKSVEIFQVSLQSNKNKAYFSWRPCAFRPCLAQFILEWEMFQTKVVENIQTHTSCPVTFFFFRKSCLLRVNVEKHCIAGQATYDNTTRRMRFACWLTKATKAHSEYVIMFCFSMARLVSRTRKKSYVIRTLPVSFHLSWATSTVHSATPLPMSLRHLSVRLTETLTIR